MDMKQLAAGVIGEKTLLETPFGSRPLIYADYTASGRAYAPIESFIRERVLPFYANTHSDSSLCGRQTQLLRDQARESIRESVGAGADDAVIFCGSGATAAINTLIDLLQLRRPSPEDGRKDGRWDCDPEASSAAPPVVLLGPYEHHSNELPWRESIAEVHRVPLNSVGRLDLVALELRLQEFSSRQVFCSFSAASNVTGLKTDVDAITALTHAHGAHTFWDYAAAAPYLRMTMQGKSALFISPHKFLGGPGTPGVLVVKKELLRSRIPARPGGGTVAFVSPDSHRYLEDIERREEGGTPAIVESVRAGLVFQLQRQVGIERIEAREAALVEQVLQRWSGHPQIEIVGEMNADRLSIVSFQVIADDQPLHYGFVVALLNDVFGIQARGGCSCAGPYGHDLLDIDVQHSRLLDEQVARGHSVLRPGWVRMNFNYFINEETLEYLLRAVELIADHGRKMLCQYQFCATSGTWQHRNGAPPVPVDLADFDGLHSVGAPPLASESLLSYMTLAREVLTAQGTPSGQPSLSLDAAAESLRWFYLPAAPAGAISGANC